MSEAPAPYDPRYLGGIQFFNTRDFFEAHEVWEDLWMDCAGPERRFYQALIQAAVALYHFGNGNVRGATKLYRSSRAYHEPYCNHYLGLDLARFWQQMAVCFQDVLTDTTAGPPQLDDALIPTIALEPPPGEWPDPAQFIAQNES
jgi:predicted metal-dependent hydrolase